MFNHLPHLISLFLLSLWGAGRRHIAFLSVNMMGGELYPQCVLAMWQGSCADITLGPVVDIDGGHGVQVGWLCLLTVYLFFAPS